MDIIYGEISLIGCHLDLISSAPFHLEDNLEKAGCMLHSLKLIKKYTPLSNCIG